MNDCIFCKIVKGEISSFKVFENEQVFAFLDIAKDIDAHILVIPKKHCLNVLDCEEESLKAVMLAVQKISKHLVDNCGFDGVNLINCSGESAGQTVNHFHVHIIPRKENDGEQVFPKLSGAKEELSIIWERIRME